MDIRERKELRKLRDELEKANVKLQQRLNKVTDERSRVEILAMMQTNIREMYNIDRLLEEKK